MALLAGEFEKLQSDFRSGRNPKAYIPISQELRRRKRHGEALTVCQNGLSRDPVSVAGRTELVRILADLGRFEDGLREIEAMERGGVQAAFGLTLQKLRCEVRLNRLDEAAETLADLESQNPFEPSLGAFRSELRSAAEAAAGRRGGRGRDKSAFEVRPTGADLVRHLRTHVQTLGKVLAVALVDLENKQSFVEGDDLLAEVAAQFERETALACEELGHGRVAYGLIETRFALVIAVRRGSKLVVVATEPSVNYGRLQHRVMLLLDRNLPAPAGARRDSPNETA